MRTVSLLVLLISSSRTLAGDFMPDVGAKETTLPMEVGQVGKFKDNPDFPQLRLLFAVHDVIGPREAVIVAFFGDLKKSASHFYFVLSGVETSKWVDGKIIPLEQEYKVTGTKKRGGKTMYLLEPAKK